MLHIYNSLSKHKQPFTPIKAGQVGLYVCGITVYDYCHIGHARTWVCFDTMVRHLKASGYQVNYVRNITDIDDKIIKRAQDNGESITALTDRFIEAMHLDAKALYSEAPDHEPRATAYIPEMIDMIARLVDQGFAYVGQTGDVYFNVERYPAYGSLSGQDLQQLQAGARVGINNSKHNPLDFVLWKLAKPGEPAWPSPWGEGRPGWHIECSAMSHALLGGHFDLHGGGHDLLFPHHENELAQSVCANHQPFVNSWLHIGFVQVDDEKMSKSLGNFFTIREVLAKIPAEVVRYLLVAPHYRSPINYSEAALKQAEQGLSRFYQALRHLPTVDEVPATPHLAAFETRFMAAMDDDFNTPEALAVLYDLAREINRLKDQHHPDAALYGALLKRLGQRLGLLHDAPEAFFQRGAEVGVEQIEALIQAREDARQQKQWAVADGIRAQLLAEGIVLEDSSDGVSWKKISA